MRLTSLLPFDCKRAGRRFIRYIALFILGFLAAAGASSFGFSIDSVGGFL